MDDHPCDSDQYTRALLYVYNCQLYTATAIAPFELVIKKSSQPHGRQWKLKSPSSKKADEGLLKNMAGKAITISQPGAETRSSTVRGKLGRHVAMER